ncbi:UNVERIFIED_ORG: hypothetical protein ABIB21_003326 [Arthrobacter sp. UYEF13]
MSQTGPLEKRPATGRSTATLGWLMVPAAVVVGMPGLFFAANSGTPGAMVTGDFSVLVAALSAAAGLRCAAA